MMVWKAGRLRRVQVDAIGELDQIFNLLINVSRRRQDGCQVYQGLDVDDTFVESNGSITKNSIQGFSGLLKFLTEDLSSKRPINSCPIRRE